MTRMLRWAQRHGLGVAWTLWLLAVAAMFVGTLVAAGSSSVVLEDAIIIAVFLVWGLLGVVIVSRLPNHSIGWLFVWVALVGACSYAAEMIARGIVGEPSPVASAAAWFGVVFADWLPPILIILLFVLFPTGSIESPLERVVIILTALGVACGAAGVALAPGALPRVGIQNPLGIAALEGTADLLLAIGNASIPILFILAFASLVRRYRRSSGQKKQQIKWLSVSAGVLAFDLVVAALATAAGASSAAGDTVGVVLFVVFVISVPATTTIAILKYRLYDIDVVINRTLVYGLLTAFLAGIYVGLVFAFQTVLRPFTAQSDLAIAGSTLAVAALFRPARSRVQGFIDRRFYRRKVDAQRTLDEFALDLRDEVDLTSLSSRLTSVVSETMQPAHVSLWLRPEGIR